MSVNSEDSRDVSSDWVSNVRISRISDLVCGRERERAPTTIPMVVGDIPFAAPAYDPRLGLTDLTFVRRGHSAVTAGKSPSARETHSGFEKLSYDSLVKLRTKLFRHVSYFIVYDGYLSLHSIISNFKRHLKGFYTLILVRAETLSG